MKCLVTGATGFVGSYVVRTLLARGHHVAATVRPGSDPWRLHGLQGALERVPSAFGATDELRRFFDAGAPDAVLHLAWSGVNRAQRDDPAFIESNVLGSTELARLAFAAGCSTWVGLGSQAELAPGPSVFDETSAEGPDSIYGACKVATRVITERLAQLHRARFVWLRLLSTYGPHEDRARLLPYAICALHGRELPSFGACRQLWDYLFVEDAAEAIVIAAESGAVRGSYVLSSGTARPLRAVVELVRDLVAPGAPLAFDDKSGRDARALVGNPASFSRASGWAPRTSLEEGLVRTIEWYLSSGRPS